MIRIGICDDDAGILEMLERYLDRFSRENGLETECCAFGDGRMLLESDPLRFDLLILDVEMGQTNGIETARKIRSLGGKMTIIFFTNYVQYALEGYEVQAFRFLLKPLDYEQFSQVAGKALLEMQRQAGAFLSVRLRDRVVRIATGDIVYLETERGHVRLHTRDGQDLVSYSAMKEAEDALTGQSFFRCHTAFLVNMKDIRSVGTGELSLMDGTVLPVSKHRRRELKEALALYWGDQFL